MAQDFYKQNGSYFTTGGQKILNPTELQGFAKAGGKEVSAPVVPQGARGNQNIRPKRIKRFN